MAIAMLAILWPRQWEFTANPHEVIGDYIESTSPAPLEELHRQLAIDMEAGYLQNSAGLAKLVVYFQAANVLLAIEVMLWMVAIALSAWRGAMTETRRSTPALKTKRPSLMQPAELTFRESLRLFVPGWLKRASRRRPSS